MFCLHIELVTGDVVVADVVAATARESGEMLGDALRVVAGVPGGGPAWAADLRADLAGGPAVARVVVVEPARAGADAPHGWREVAAAAVEGGVAAA